MPGQPQVEYSLVVNDTQGNRLAIIDDYISLAAARSMGQVGAFTFTLPSDYDPTLFQVDGLVELWRSLDGVPKLFLDTVWFIRRRQQIGALREPGAWKITAYDGLFLFGDPRGSIGRNVAYNANNAFTLKLDEADDMIKAIVRENAGALATDTARDLSAYLTVQADVAAAAIIKKNFERRNVLAVLQEIAAASAEAGTYLAFDTVCLTPPSAGTFALQFQTFTVQRGVDHRASSGQPVLLGPDFGNLDHWELDDDTSAEANYIYAGGQSVADVQAIATATDSARTGLSPFNRREVYVDASSTLDATSLQDEADSALRANRLRKVLTGEMLDTDQARYGVDWGYGDYLTAQVQGQSFDCRADALEMQFDRDGGERLRPTLRGDDV